jgi:hypothetical protein
VAAFADPVFTCRIISLLYGLSVGCTFAERLVYLSDYGKGGWFAWEIFRHDRIQIAAFRRLPRVTGLAFGPGGMLVALYVGLLGVVVMWVTPVSCLLFTIGVAATVSTCLFIQARSCFGGDGAHQMNIIIGVAILVGFNPWLDRAVGNLSLVFIAAQACLAYCASGVAKLVSPIWRSGDALPKILATVAYGSNLGFQLMNRVPKVSRWVCRGTVLAETIFPICIAAPAPLLLSFLAWGVMFHIANGLLMGLNTFLFSFVGTYPAILYTWYLLH